MGLVSFSKISLSEPILDGRKARAKVSCVSKSGEVHDFVLMAKYQEPLVKEDVAFLRMAMAMPMMNYGLFSEEIRFDFPLCRSDMLLIEELLTVFSKDIFVNKLARKHTIHILPEYVPREEDNKEVVLPPIARMFCANLQEDYPLSQVEGDACGILSSGGKESLLTYGLLSELGVDVHPLYVAESGGHWRTAVTGYRYHLATDQRTGKVWSNVDRFYNFMLDHLHFIRNDHRRVWSDTYPLRLCIFPFYIFLLLPLFSRRNISNVLLGSEFDDIRDKPVFRGIEHHHGIYDQTQNFDILMEHWYSNRLPGTRQWSAVRPISGLVVERMLVKRYPRLAELQRSCHSCAILDGKVIPCGKCSKCLGVMLFLAASDLSPYKMGFKSEDVKSFPDRISRGGLKLDEEEMGHSLFLAGRMEGGTKYLHVEKIHFHNDLVDLCRIPEIYRRGILDMLEEYTEGYSSLHDGEWRDSSREESLKKCA